MSAENLDAPEGNEAIIRAFWKAWTPGEELPMFPFDPEVVYEDANLPDHIGETYRGHEGMARAAKRWFEAYEWMTIELVEVIGSGDRLVSSHRVRAKSRYAGIEEEGSLAYLWTFRDGKVVHFRSYRSAEEALAQLQGG
jgi:ketosteroid isomerase-like protein